MVWLIQKKAVSVLKSFSTDKNYGEIGLSENSPSSSEGSDSSELWLSPERLRFSPCLVPVLPHSHIDSFFCII